MRVAAGGAVQTSGCNDAAAGWGACRRSGATEVGSAPTATSTDRRGVSREIGRTCPSHSWPPAVSGFVRALRDRPVDTWGSPHFSRARSKPEPQTSIPVGCRGMQDSPQAAGRFTRAAATTLQLAGVPVVDQARLKWGEPHAATGRSRSARAMTGTPDGGSERGQSRSARATTDSTDGRVAGYGARLPLPLTAARGLFFRSCAPRPPSGYLGLAPLQSRSIETRDRRRPSRSAVTGCRAVRWPRYGFPFERD